MDKLALLRGIKDTHTYSLFSEIVALKEGWPLVRVATYRGTTISMISENSMCLELGMLSENRMSSLWFMQRANQYALRWITSMATPLTYYNTWQPR